MACRLLGFSPEELCGLTLVQLLNRQHAHTPYALSEEHLDTNHGTTLGVSGKVVSSVFHCTISFQNSWKIAKTDTNNIICHRLK